MSRGARSALYICGERRLTTSVFSRRDRSCDNIGMVLGVAVVLGQSLRTLLQSEWKASCIKNNNFGAYFGG